MGLRCDDCGSAIKSPDFMRFGPIGGRSATELCLSCALHGDNCLICDGQTPWMDGNAQARDVNFSWCTWRTYWVNRTEVRIHDRCLDGLLSEFVARKEHCTDIADLCPAEVTDGR